MKVQHTLIVFGVEHITKKIIKKSFEIKILQQIQIEHKQTIQYCANIFVLD